MFYKMKSKPIYIFIESHTPEKHVSSICSAFRRLAFLFLLLFTLFVRDESFAQQPAFAFQATLTGDTILIGDHVELNIKASLPGTYDIFFPNYADTLIKGIEVLGPPVIDTLIKRNGDRELTYRLNLTSFEEGDYRIPRILLPFTDGAKVDTALTSPLWLRVNTLPPDTTKAPIYDIKMPYSVPVTFAEIAKWSGLVLLAAAIIALLIYYFKKRKKGEPVFFPAKRTEPPHIIALRQLEMIKDQKLWNTDNPKHYYTVLIDVIRFYIDGRFGVSAMEQTTFETIRDLKNNGIVNSNLLESLDEKMTLADMVKFARFKPDIAENEECLNFGFRFVNETKVEEEEVKQEQEQDEVMQVQEAVQSEGENPVVEPEKQSEHDE